MDLKFRLYFTSCVGYLSKTSNIVHIVVFNYCKYYKNVISQDYLDSI